VKLHIEDRVPTVEGTLEGHEGRFRLDTGSNDPLTVFPQSVEKWKLLDGREGREVRLGGVGGAVAARSGAVRSFALGPVRLENVEANFVTEAKGSSGDVRRDGRIGVGLLKDVVMTLDYAGGRIWFRKGGA
jgi:hypothetical protein